mmetsp:Transcript_20796/g.51235  ORF Transcript_20796/g.51235 Transcript_20796/m.51235 type:complete len:113 (-) Transcript_20796:256-594(-)
MDIETELAMHQVCLIRENTTMAKIQAERANRDSIFDLLNKRKDLEETNFPMSQIDLWLPMPAAVRDSPGPPAAPAAPAASTPASQAPPAPSASPADSSAAPGLGASNNEELE